MTAQPIPGSDNCLRQQAPAYAPDLPERCR